MEITSSDLLAIKMLISDYFAGNEVGNSIVKVLKSNDVIEEFFKSANNCDSLVSALTDIGDIAIQRGYNSIFQICQDALSPLGAAPLDWNIQSGKESSD